MTDAFGVAKALADTPKVFQPLLRYGNQIARVGGTQSRTGQAVRQRLALKASAGQPAASSRAAFDGINEAMKAPKAAPSNAGMEGLSRAMNQITAPKAAPVAPKPDRRRLKRAAVIGGTALGSGGVVLGADALNDRRKAKRAQLAG